MRFTHQLFEFDDELEGSALSVRDVNSIAHPETAAKLRAPLNRRLRYDGDLATDVTGDPNEDTSLREALLGEFEAERD